MTLRVRRAAVAGGLALLLAAGAFAALRPRQRWATMRASRGDLAVTVEITGTLAAEDSLSVGPPQSSNTWQFRITRMAPEGSTVKRGEPVLGFDPAELQRQLEERTAEAETAARKLEKRSAELAGEGEDARLAIAEAESELRKAAIAAEVPDDVVARRDLAKARLDLGLARERLALRTARLDAAQRAGDAELASLRSQRDRARERAAELTAAIAALDVPAPRDGTVIYVTSRRSRDEKHKVGDTVWRGERLLEIATVDRLRAEGEVAETDAGRVRPGQRVSLRLDAHPDQLYLGRVVAIAGTVAPRSLDDPRKVARVRVALDATDAERMRPGMRFRGGVEVERRHDVVTLPQAAVEATAEGPRVRRAGLFGPQLVPIEIGGRNAADVEILAGLAPGDEVLVDPAGEVASE